MLIHYVEIVTKDVHAVCNTYAAANGAVFVEPDAGLGNAGTTALPGGAMAGVPAPMSDTEDPVRPCWLVDDIEAAIAAAVEAGGQVAHPPMEFPGLGTFAICIHSGIHHGLWMRSQHRPPFLHQRCIVVARREPINRVSQGRFAQPSVICRPSRHLQPETVTGRPIPSGPSSDRDGATLDTGGRMT